MKTTKIYANLHCASCEIKVQNAVKNIAEDTKVNSASGLIKIKYDENKTNEKELKSKITDLGYEITE
ncbi:heavy-metal-associated domain-containing protein [Mycoplasma marinum]|uniref:HMA domain-containing protein n=1 Tax=Mycoplasma marinum TaxID=1937190 RepID=A0A4R0XKX1_9MOLU|nr:heavy-metal-associated domain-containing protein [Mycoplasma marinum]TCG11114.1 hypothetical protein C4B24_02870 [Mycoplasma marinum]